MTTRSAPAPSPGTLRSRPIGASQLIAFGDLLMQCVNVAAVHEVMSKQEAQTNEIQKKLDDMIERRRKGGKANDTSATATSSSSSSTSQLAKPLPIPPTGTAMIIYPTLTTTRQLALKARRKNLDLLRTKLTSETRMIQDLREKVLSKRQAILPRCATLSSLSTTLTAHKSSLAEAHRLRREHAQQASLLQIQLMFRRRAMLTDLWSIYPISPPRQSMKHTQVAATHPLMCYTIRGLRLPNNFNNILTSFDEEQVSTALGYVCHLLIMISKFLDVPLRYRMIYRGSRSVICDDVTASSQFPLYFKNMEERRFELGVILLNKNIEHLLAVRLDANNPYTKHVRELTYTLENLDVLFKAEMPQ